MQKDRRIVADYLIIGALVIVSVFGMLNLAPSAGSATVAVVFAPWVDSASALSRAAAAGAPLVGTGGVPFIVIVRAGPNDLPARLRAEGALLILDARAAKGCDRNRRVAT